MSRLGRRLLATCAVALALAASAAAGWTSRPSATATLAAATVAPPTAPTATSDCRRFVRNDVILAWTPSTSPFVDGYEIYRASGGAPSLLATLPASTTGYTDTGLAYSRAYTYTVRATVGTWQSVDAAVSITTPNSRCR